MAEELTLEHKATNDETWKHISRVQQLLNQVSVELMRRAMIHDQSKLKHPEVEIFTEFTPKLKGVTYGSEEYKGYLQSMSVALKHHYEKNSHHPEHYPNGVDDMDLCDIVEMLCDWKAATERHNDGNIHKSIDGNTTRFQLSHQLAQVFRNTVKSLGWG